MVRVNGIWAPCKNFQFDDLEFLREALTFVSSYSLAIEENASIGIWAFMLSKYFSKVYAFEEDQKEFTCLRRNLFTRLNAMPIYGSLDDHVKMTDGLGFIKLQTKEALEAWEEIIKEHCPVVYVKDIEPGWLRECKEVATFGNDHVFIVN